MLRFSRIDIAAFVDAVYFRRQMMLRLIAARFDMI